MKRGVLAILFFCILAGNRSYGQIGVVADKAYVRDTLKTNSISTGLSFLFYISDNEMNENTYYKFLNSAHLTYVFKKTDIEFSLRQTIEHETNNEWSTNNLVYLTSGIFKYREIGEDKTVLRKLYIEPIAIYQNNSDRGLRRRFQLGNLIHPWSYFHPKFNVNVGAGMVYDWASWEVNDKDAVAAAEPELQNKIKFINSRIKLRKDMYQDHSEWRPMLLVTINYKMSETVSFSLNTLYQQSLVSPYSDEIKSAYPDLAKVHPYILTQFDINVKLYKGLMMSIATSVDYENSNLSLYKSSWAYSVLMGLSWTFTNQK